MTDRKLPTNNRRLDMDYIETIIKLELRNKKLEGFVDRLISSMNHHANCDGWKWGDTKEGLIKGCDCGYYEKIKEAQQLKESE